MHRTMLGVGDMFRSSNQWCSSPEILDGGRLAPSRSVHRAGRAQQKRPHPRSRVEGASTSPPPPPCSSASSSMNQTAGAASAQRGAVDGGRRCRGGREAARDRPAAPTSGGGAEQRGTGRTLEGRGRRALGLQGTSFSA